MTIREYVNKHGDIDYSIEFFNGNNSIGIVPKSYVKSEMALNAVNMTFFNTKKMYSGFPPHTYIVFQVRDTSNVHYIGLMYRLIGEYRQFTIEERGR